MNQAPEHAVSRASCSGKAFCEDIMEKERYFQRNIVFPDESQLLQCMKHFSSKEDFSLSFNNFKDLIADLISDSKGKSYEVPESMLSNLFTTFDCNKDGQIDVKEFNCVWNDFIKPLINPVTALLIIDVQNDFIDGSLALKNCPAKQDGKDVIPVINYILDSFKFDSIVYTLDCHPENHISFFENISLYKLSKENKHGNEISVFDTVLFEGPPDMSQKLWPSHCIKNSWGSELHDELKLTRDCLFVYKGTNPAIDSYSAFFDNMKKSQTILHEKLKERNVTHVFILGLAFDYCVRFTALDALELGYVTVLIRDATRGTDDNNMKMTENQLNSVNCVLANSHEIENLITGKDIRVEFLSVFLRMFNGK